MGLGLGFRVQGCGILEFRVSGLGVGGRGLTVKFRAQGFRV